MSIDHPLAIAIVLANVVLGAVLYLDVVRSGRNQLWLFAFWLFSVPAMVAYWFTRQHAGRSA